MGRNGPSKVAGGTGSVSALTAACVSCLLFVVWSATTRLGDMRHALWKSVNTGETQERGHQAGRTQERRHQAGGVTALNVSFVLSWCCEVLCVITVIKMLTGRLIVVPPSKGSSQFITHQTQPMTASAMSLPCSCRNHAPA